MRWLRYIFLTIFSLGLLAGITVAALVVFIISTYSKDLPDYSQLKDYKPAVVTRIYAGDGRLLAEYAQEKRVFVPIDSIPPIVRQAFLAAEDQHFYQHSGVDYTAILRAIVSNLKNRGSGRRPVGASTITQQVAKNFLLGNEFSYKRKIREAILAFRMERAMTKDHLLELYLNEIYLGEGTYGVAAAALNYFNKPLEDITIEEAAYLASLPKAPNNYNPSKHPEAARTRRDWVIGRLAEDHYITNDQAKEAQKKPLQVVEDRGDDTVAAPYFAEEVRREIQQQYGSNALYEGGLAVRSSVDPKLQALAQESLRDGLEAYDRRRGWRGPLGHIEPGKGWEARLNDFAKPPGKRTEWRMAMVIDAGASGATLGFPDGSRGKLPVAEAQWAKTGLSSLRQIVKDGDVIFVAPAKDKDGKNTDDWSLRQLPKVSGALVAMDPHTGRVLAIQGGWSYEQSEFDRATQALRQPGSSFKPFVYLTALENGFTPATLVVDGPFVGDQGPGMPKWRPKNYHDDYLGPTTLRVGVEKSRNLMTVRLAHFIGMDKVADMVHRFGVMDNMPKYLSYSLGAGETTLLRLTTGYAQFVNGGRKITPTFIDRIQDRMGMTVFAHDKRPCQDCGTLIEWEGQDAPDVPDTREQVADPRNVYQIVSILEGVVQRGTATAVKELNRPLAGKTGTTNDSKDTWFVGFSPDLVVGVFVGYDTPRTLGKKETGGSVAVPIFKGFMQEALKDQPAIPFRVPPGIKNVLINARTGHRAGPGDKTVIWEAFLDGTEPNTDSNYVLDEGGIVPGAEPAEGQAGDGVYSPGTGYPVPENQPNTGTGGLY